MSHRRWGTQIPPLGTRLDPCTTGRAGLHWALPFNDQAGVTVFNELQYYDRSNTVYTQTTHPTLGDLTGVGLSWLKGNGMRYTSTTTSFVDCGQNDITTGEITWLAWLKPNTLPTLSSIFGQNISSGVESIDSVYLTSGGNVSWWVNNTGGQTEELNGTAGSVEADNFYRIAGRRSGVSGAWNYSVWINERLNDSATGVTRNPAVRASDGNFTVGFAGAYTGAPFVGDYFGFWFWRNRALSDDTILHYSKRPGDLYMPRRAFLAWEDGGGGGGLSIPVAMHNYRRRRAG